MTPEQEKYKQDLQEAKQRYYALEGNCPHVFFNHKFYDDSDGWVECEICRRHFGWWCPKAEDHQCKYERSEHCTYCGRPSERK